MENCPRCGTAPTPGDRFCRECGGYLSTTPSFDDLEPPGSVQHDDPPGYGMGDAVQFSGPAVPAIDDEGTAPLNLPAGQEPTMERWDQPATQSWFDDPGGQQHTQQAGYGDSAWAPAPPYGDANDGPVPFDDAGYAAPAYPGAGGQQPPDERRRSRRGVFVVLGALVLVVLLIIGAVYLLGGGDRDKKADAGSTTSSSASASASESSSGSASPSANTPEAQAKAVDQLLSRAAGGKSLLTTAYDQANSCEISPASAAKKFRDAAQNRRDIVDSARKLDTSQLDSGPRIKSLIISMYSTSAKADDAFAAWADDGAAKNVSCLKGNAKRTKGNNLSIKAGKSKQQFVKVWNPVAEQYGHTKRTKNGL